MQKPMESDSYFTQNCDYYNGCDGAGAVSSNNYGNNDNNGDGYMNYANSYNTGYCDTNESTGNEYYTANAPQDGMVPNEEIAAGYEPQFYPNGEYESYDNLDIDFAYGPGKDDYGTRENGSEGTNCSLDNEPSNRSDDENKT